MILPYVCNGVCLEYVGFIHEELEVSVYVPVLIAMFGISFSGKLLGSVVDQRVQQEEVEIEPWCCYWTLHEEYTTHQGKQRIIVVCMCSFSIELLYVPVPKRNLDIQIGAGRFANSEIWGVGGRDGAKKKKNKNETCTHQKSALHLDYISL